MTPNKMPKARDSVGKIELKTFLSDMERYLLKRRLEMIEQYNTARSHLDQQVMESPGDTADESVMDVNADYFFKLAQQNQHELTEIRDALDRIHQGKYGTCLDCENPIAYERLQSLPYAKYCVNCQRMREKVRSFRIISPL